MGDTNPIRTLGDYSKPSYEGYKNTIELPEGNNVVPLRSDTIRSQLSSVRAFPTYSPREDNNPSSLAYTTQQRLATMGDTNPIRTLGDYSKPSYEGYKNTIELPEGNNVVPLRFDTIRELLEDLALYDNASWNDPRDFAKSIKAIFLPQDVPSTSDCRLIELQNQVQCLMEAHIALMQPIQVNKITSSCKICSGPTDTQYCMEDFKQAFVEYACLRTDEARDKCNSYMK
nr:MAK10-like protein [Tanacetum cinerariifolium]